MASSLARVATRRALSTTSLVRATIQLPAAERDRHYPRIGNREVVGFGFNGSPNYMDREDFPAPAIRFREETEEVKKLREKEKGDWKNLSMDEKKQLYRTSFCQTFSELQAPTGEWKALLAGVLLGLSVTGWFMIYLKAVVYEDLPPTITKEWQEDQVRYMIKQRHGHVEGLASRYDYDKKQWK